MRLSEQSLFLRVNGREIRDSVDGDTTLLSYLRNHLGLTGAKNGCGQGQCGTCTVLVDGRPMKSCLIKLKSPKLTGTEILTIEGLTGKNGVPHPIQDAFVNAVSVHPG